MLQNNNDDYPRTAGGYSLETYEPTVTGQDQRKRAEDLVRMAFTDQKPVSTIKMFQPTAQINMIPKPVLSNAQYGQVQKISTPMMNNPNIRRVQVINPIQNNIIGFKNVPAIIPIPTVKSADTNPKSTPILYQNLIGINNGYLLPNNNVSNVMNQRNRFIVSNFNNQRPKPILRSNSANNNYNLNFGRRIIQKNIITGPNYQLHVYKRFV